MLGKICLVTGGTSGIGRETARGLADRGATVVLTGRDPARAEQAARELRGRTGNDEVHGVGADLSSLASVRALAEHVLERFDALHVLVNNAGLWHPERTLSADGHEDTFAVNHLAHFALTLALRDRLIASAPARVVTVSSRLHAKEKRFDFEDPMGERRYSGMRAYRQSKLANVMFANELAERLAGTGVTSNSLHPGDVATSVVRDNRLLQWASDWLGRLVLLTPEEGARTSLRAATAPELERVTGTYFRDGRPAAPSPAALEGEGRARLWSLSESLIERS